MIDLSLALQLGSIALLCAVHLGSHLIRRIDHEPRSKWLSFAGGVSVAYAMMHLLPEIAEGSKLLVRKRDLWLAGGNIWAIALCGLVGFYVVGTLVRRTKARQRDDDNAAFWLHAGAFAAYNVVTGYLIQTEESHGVRAALFFAVAMALHFLITDQSLRIEHPKQWLSKGRWVMTIALIAGAILGLMWRLPEHLVYAMTAFLGGTVLLTVMKEELPRERDSRLVPFLIGAGGYAVLLGLAH